MTRSTRSVADGLLQRLTLGLVSASLLLHVPFLHDSSPGQRDVKSSKRPGSSKESYAGSRLTENTGSFMPQLCPQACGKSKSVKFCNREVKEQDGVKWRRQHMVCSDQSSFCRCRDLHFSCFLPVWTQRSSSFSHRSWEKMHFALSLRADFSKRGDTALTWNPAPHLPEWQEPHKTTCYLKRKRCVDSQRLKRWRSRTPARSGRGRCHKHVGTWTILHTEI